MRRLTLDYIQEITSKRGGFCLSKKYVNNSTKLIFQCENSHEWWARPSNIIKGSWCPKCSSVVRALKKTKHNIEEMREIAKERGGECLSVAYKNLDEHLQWKCKDGHIWWAIPYWVIKGGWCPHCAGNYPLGLEHTKRTAAKKGGECLSSEYINNSTKLIYRCEYGHVWTAVPAFIETGGWCPRCAGKARTTIDEVRDVVEKKHGTLLTSDIKNQHSKLSIRCKNGHEWVAIAKTLKRGHWCPFCNNFICQEKIRSIFEKIFKEKFPKERPIWLMGKQGRSLELDGYNQKLALAFEYNGEQHYDKNNYFHTMFSAKKDSFKRLMENDERKRILCPQNGVTLIEIPYTVKPKKYKEYIIEELNKRGVKI